VGIAAAGRAVQDAKKVGQVKVTGLGLPSQLNEYVKSGAIPAFALWNPVDLGYPVYLRPECYRQRPDKGSPRQL